LVRDSQSARLGDGFVAVLAFSRSGSDSGPARDGHAAAHRYAAGDGILDSLCDDYPNGNANAIVDPHANFDEDTDTDSHPYEHANPDLDSNRDGDPNGLADGYDHADADGHPDGDGHAHAHPHEDGYADQDGHPDDRPRFGQRADRLRRSRR
jgi:hypothetical protein